MKKREPSGREPLEPHELAGELTHEQRVKLAEGLGALYRRKVAEDKAQKALRASAAYQQLLGKVNEVFSDDLDCITETQEAIVYRLIELTVEESGGPENVTLAQVEGVKKMLENEFGMANAKAEEWARAKGK